MPDAGATPALRWGRGGAAYTAAAAALLALFAALATTSMARQSITGDEVAHLPAGYSYVATGDLRLNPQHPPLIKALAGLPLLAFDLKPVEQMRGWPRAREWIFGKTFLLDNTQPLDRLVFWGRLPMVGVGVLLGAGLFAWARRLWGDAPGLCVLALYVLCPNFLAHAPLVHTDVGVACFTLLSVYALWRYAAAGQLGWAAACGIGLGGALLAKYSGLVSVAVVALLFAATVVARRRVLALRGADVTAAALVLAVLPLAMILLGGGVRAYVRGVGLVHADANPEWQAFLWGAYSKDGFWNYYLLAQLWKTPLPTLLAFAAALLLVGRARRATWLDWTFVLLPIAAFHAAGMWQRSSIGVRHVLPALPFILLACGASADWALRRGRGGRLIVAAVGVWLAVGTLRMWPHFLPFFNELAGGPAGGARLLDDSNVEWGQGLAAVGEYLAAHGDPPARMLAFEPLPRAVYGIHAGPMRLRDVAWPQPGITYLGGASTLQRNSPLGVRAGWLERYRPIERIGWSVYVYRFSVDPADAGRDDVRYVPREQWYGDAIAMLEPLNARTPEAEAALAAVYADRAAWREQQGLPDAALSDALRAALSDRRQARAFRDAIERLAGQVEAPAGSVEDAFERAAAACHGTAETSPECLLALLRVVRQAPEHRLACLNLGSVYAGGGFVALAEREWERCLRIDPSFAPARENLLRLRASGGVATPR